jgi:hypothetical protein
MTAPTGFAFMEAVERQLAKIDPGLVAVWHRERVTILPRDGGMVVRMRGPYNTYDVDYWPTTGTCAQLRPNGTPIVYRRVTVEFAEELAYTGIARYGRNG